MQFSLKFHLLAKPVRGSVFWKRVEMYRGFNFMRIPVEVVITCYKDLEQF